MAEYIDMHDVIETIRYRVCQGQGNKEHICQRGSCAYCGIMEIMSDISALSAADVQPVKRGEWKYYKNNGIYDTYKCSICNTPFELPMDADISQSMHYCPDCGAKMTND